MCKGVTNDAATRECINVSVTVPVLLVAVSLAADRTANSLRIRSKAIKGQTKKKHSSN